MRPQQLGRLKTWHQLMKPDHTVMHVPVLPMIQELFKNTDILSKIREPNTDLSDYKKYKNDSYFCENMFLSTEDLTLCFQLYIDDLEIATSLGTSHKVHKHSVYILGPSQSATKIQISITHYTTSFAGKSVRPPAVWLLSCTCTTDE